MVEIELHDGKEPILLRSYESGWEICWKRNQYPDPNDKTVVEQYWAAAKYHPVLSMALNAIAEMKIRNSGAGSIQELIKVVIETRNEITKVFTANVPKERK